MKKEQKRKSSLENALSLLALFSMDEPELSVTSISKKLYVSKSTAHRLLSTLVLEEFVYKDAKTNLYSLGSSILSLVNIVNSQIHISTEVIPLLNILVEKTKESAHLAILENRNTVYIQTMEGVYPCKEPIQLGTKRSSYRTAAGQVMLAFHPDLAKMAMQDIEAFTESLATFEQKLSTIRAEGYAISNGAFNDDVIEIAVPVYKNERDVIASISITGNLDRITATNLQKKYIHLLQHAADELRKMIQFRRSGKNGRK